MTFADLEYTCMMLGRALQGEKPFANILALFLLRQVRLPWYGAEHMES